MTWQNHNSFRESKGVWKTEERWANSFTIWNTEKEKVLEENNKSWKRQSQIMWVNYFECHVEMHSVCYIKLNFLSKIHFSWYNQTKAGPSTASTQTTFEETARRWKS